MSYNAKVSAIPEPSTFGDRERSYGKNCYNLKSVLQLHVAQVMCRFFILQL